MWNQKLINYSVRSPVCTWFIILSNSLHFLRVILFTVAVVKATHTHSEPGLSKRTGGFELKLLNYAHIWMWEAKITDLKITLISDDESAVKRSIKFLDSFTIFDRFITFGIAIQKLAFLHSRNSITENYISHSQCNPIATRICGTWFVSNCWVHFFDRISKRPIPMLCTGWINFLFGFLVWFYMNLRSIESPR